MTSTAPTVVRPVGHGRDGLCAAHGVHLVDAGDGGRRQDGCGHPAVGAGR